MATHTYHRKASGTAGEHAQWMELVPAQGPFVSVPVLAKVFPHGLETLPEDVPSRVRTAYEEWQDSLEGEDRARWTEEWIRFIFEEVLEYDGDLLKGGSDIPETLRAVIAEHHEVLRPHQILIDPPGPGGPPEVRMLIQVHPPGTDLETHRVPDSRWVAGPATRMAELCRGVNIPLGLITNGEEWMLVHARRGEISGFASFHAHLWVEEPITLRAFASLLGCGTFFARGEDETPERILARSQENQQEVTDQLGLQVRKAVEILVQTLDRVDRDARGTLLEGIADHELYECAVTVMMRLVFLLCAEERGLIVEDDPFYTASYAVGPLKDTLRAEAANLGEEILERRHDAFAQLLATFRMVFAGTEHPRLRLPAYGGRLFDPDRFPYLEGRKGGSSFRDTPARPLAVDNLTVLHLLESLQELKIRHRGGVSESRRLSFRSLDIEQIGHVYEGLLDHTVKRSTGLVIGMSGKKGKEPEVSVDELDRLRATSEDAVVHYLSDVTGEKEERVKGKFTYSLPKQDASRMLLLCERREEWFERIRQYGGFLRKDTFDRPVIIPPDAIYVTEGTDRRTSGTHYTPRSLTEPIVRHTLEPLVYEGPREGRPPDEWALVPPARILSLKVADTAMGSGAFLVQACRYLADRLVESWEEAVMAHGTGSGITPEGAPSTGAKGERLIPEDTEERLVYARRLIAERCLFGVDKNPMAVEMAKLSLWLITLDKHRPFTFLDHAVKAGDSLLGITDITQIIYFHPDPARGKDLTPDLFALKFQIAEAVERARIKRVELESFTEWTIEDARRKERLHEEAILAVEEVRIIADCQCAAIFESAGQSDEALDERLKGYARDLVAALQVEPGSARRRESFDRLGVWARDALNAGRPPGTPERRPFHWAVEFPEIFKGPGDGFDTIVGNPPFQGGQKLTGALGQSYREHLVHHLADGQRGSADLCAYFFLRNYDLLAPSGNFGLIATNTIAQGDTREVGLDQLRERSATIYRATPSRKWPGDANLEVAEVWLTRGTWAGASALGDKLVPGITAYLAVPGKAVGKPYRLAANAGKSFQGSIVLGMGFVLTPEEAEALIEKDPRNRDCLFPYLNGKDLNSRPDQSPSRWVINFFDWPLEKAESYPDLIQIVREKVKPERDRNNRKVYRDRWWHYAEKRPALYEAIAGMERVLSLSLVNNHLGIGRVLTGTVFAHKLAVFPLDGGAIFGILQSSFHYKWAWEHSSTMRLDINYSPSDCFDTFPFPHLSGSPHATAIDQIGETYHEHRRQLMLERQEGLTSTYNRFHNPTEASADIARLRSLHVEMDQAVAAAYGWTDLDLGHDFHQTKQGLRFTISEPARQEVLDRLLELNYARYAEEVKQGLHSKAGKAKKASRKRGAGTKKAGAAVGSGKGKKGTKDQGRLF